MNSSVNPCVHVDFAEMSHRILQCGNSTLGGFQKKVLKKSRLWLKIAFHYVTWFSCQEHFYCRINIIFWVLKKNCPQKHQNSCSQTLHSRYSWEATEKTVVEADELCKQTSQGNAHYCAFLVCLFVCVASPSPSSLYCLSLNGKQRCLILEVALLLVTLHFSLFDTRGLARSRCWPARCQHWHGELATRVRVIALAPSSLLIHPASLSKAFSKGGSLMTDTAKAVLLRGLTKRHKERCEPFNVMYLFIVFSWSLECWWGNSVRHCPKLILVGTLVTYYLLQTKRGIVLWVSLKA